MRVLVLSARLTDRRRRALAQLGGDAADVSVAAVGEPHPDPCAFDAVLLDGIPCLPTPNGLDTLRAAVEQGTSLVVLGVTPTETGGAEEGGVSAWLGVQARPGPPPGEYFAKVTTAVSSLTARMPAEFVVVDRFTPLEPRGRGAVLVEVRVAYRDLPAVVERSLGAGRVVVCGLGNTDEGLGCPELAQLLRRAFRRASDLPGATRPVGIGVVGYGPLGGMGYHHGLAVRETAGLELVAVVDPDLDRRKAAEADFPGVHAYSSLDDLIADDDVEVAFVATPPRGHADLSLALLRGGKHVACEKPLCLRLAEADRLIATAVATDRVLTVHQNRRWDPDFVAIRRVVQAGLLGEVFSVETFVGGFAHPCRTWHSEASISGGAVYDWGSHHVDWILELMGGLPVVVQSHGHKRVWHDVTNLDQLRVRLTWADGREAEFLQSDVAGIRRPKFYVQGTAGTLVGHYRELTFERIEPGRGYVAEPAHHAEAPAELRIARYESGYGLIESRLPPAPEAPFAFHRNLADHLQLGEPLAVTPESVRRVIAVLEAACESGDHGGVPLCPGRGGA
jgi:predicted dehydrogenase